MKIGLTTGLSITPTLTTEISPFTKTRTMITVGAYTHTTSTFRGQTTSPTSIITKGNQVRLLPKPNIY